MKKWIIGLGILLISSSTMALTAWQKVKQPVAGKAQSIGEYSNGCVIGAKALSLNDPFYQVTKPGQLRYFGHPDLIAFIQRLSVNVEKKTGGITLIGDMGMPAGGRFSSGHASHQTGLDVDIWLQLPQKRWTHKQLNSPKAVTLVQGNKRIIPSLWSKNLVELVKQAALDQRVARIFVHPAIKQQLCLDAGKDRDWLNRVRPWFGHRAHMHVRLTCPVGSKNCINQDPQPSGDGCGSELAGWLAESNLPNANPNQPAPPPLPKGCQQLLDNHFKSN